jgi:y4mF family transcriptional regulator
MNIINPVDLGALVRSRRKQLKVNQAELAMTCGTGLRFIVDLEKGKATCQIGKVMAVLRILGLSIEVNSPHGSQGGT